MSTLENWNTRHLDRYRIEVEDGKHDDTCEQRERSSLCHCSKRRRESVGFTEPPEIIHHAPSCGRCDRDLSCDGDSWRCYGCSTSWDIDASDWDRGEFTDEYGDIGGGGERFGRLLLDVIGGDDEHA